MEIKRPYPHEDRQQFAAMLGHTARVEGFRAELIEKDYFCSLVLKCLHDREAGLVFKGGTCLGKVHLGFYRMSEDLDFCISTPAGSTRKQRQVAAVALKEAVATLVTTIPGLQLRAPLEGRNESTQYCGEVAYGSALGAREGAIKIEIALRETLLHPPELADARTMARDPFTGAALLPPFPVAAIELQESLAEKVRAALTRLEPAIRDFYDLDYVVRLGHLKPDDRGFLEMVRSKLTAPGTCRVDMSEEKLSELGRQVETQLRPVLRDRDFTLFDLDRIYGVVMQIAGATKK